MNSVRAFGDYEDFKKWIEYILHYEMAKSFWGQVMEDYGLKVMCLGIHLTRIRIGMVKFD